MESAFLFHDLDPANRFAMEGLNVAFAAELNHEGKPLPKMLFMDVMVEKITNVNRSHQTISVGFIVNSKYQTKTWWQ